MSINFRILTELPSADLEAAWNTCLDSAEFASYYTSPAIFSDPIFSSSHPFAILAVAGGEVRGVLTGTRQVADIRCGLHATPQVCFPTPSPDPDADRALASGLMTFAARHVDLITVYSWTPLSGLKEAKFRERRLGLGTAPILLDLAKGSDILFKEMSETRRTRIRRALKAKVVIEDLRHEEFDDYYELYTHWCQFKRLPLQPYEAQRSFLNARSNRLVLAAKYEGKLVGVSIFRFRRPGIMEYAANVSRREDARLYQNDLLLWRAIEWSASHGIRYFSTAASHFFLQRFGGTLKETFEYRRDFTLFRRHLISDMVGDLALTVYRRTPDSIRTRAKALLRGQLLSS